MVFPSQAPPPSARTVHQDDSLTLATWDRVIIAITQRVPEDSQFSAFDRHARDIGGRYPRGIGVVIIPEGPVKTGFDRDALLKRAARSWNALRPHMAACAALVEADGFVGSFRRGILTSLLLMASKNTPAKVFANRQDLTAWLGSQVAPQGSRYAEQLAEALGSLRAAS